MCLCVPACVCAGVPHGPGHLGLGQQVSEGVCLSADQLSAAHTAGTAGCLESQLTPRLPLLVSVRFLWGYDPSMDSELQEVFNTVVAAGVNVSGTHTGQAGAGCVNNREAPGCAHYVVAKSQQSLLYDTALPKAGATPDCVCVCPD